MFCFGQGLAFGRYPATTGSEIAVAHNCGATGTAYRFQIPLTKDVSSAYGGEPVYIYGVSSLGLSNNLLANGGAIPNPGVSNNQALDFLEPR